MLVGLAKVMMDRAQIILKDRPSSEYNGNSGWPERTSFPICDIFPFADFVPTLTVRISRVALVVTVSTRLMGDCALEGEGFVVLERRSEETAIRTGTKDEAGLLRRRKC